MNDLLDYWPVAAFFLGCAIVSVAILYGFSLIKNDWVLFGIAAFWLVLSIVWFATEPQLF